MTRFHEMDEGARAAVERWTHEPPCPLGGYTEVTPLLVVHDRCPLCGGKLQPPPSVVEHRKKEEALEAAWRPPTPEQVLKMGDGERKETT